MQSYSLLYVSASKPHSVVHRLQRAHFRSSILTVNSGRHLGDHHSTPSSSSPMTGLPALGAQTLSGSGSMMRMPASSEAMYM